MQRGNDFTREQVALSSEKLNPRYPLLRPVHLFEQCVGVLGSHLTANSDSDRDAVEDAFQHAVQIVYEYYRGELQKLRPAPPTCKPVPEEEKPTIIRFNDSCHYMKILYRRAILKSRLRRYKSGT